MSKKIITLAMVVAFVASTAAVTFAGDCKGKVKGVEGAIITVTCTDGTEAKAEGVAKIGDSVDVKGGKDRRQEEGDGGMLIS